MDSLTQAALGAGISGAMLGRFHGRKALLAGALLATLPDLDVLIDYGDPVSGMINHRGFSHSLFVLTGVAALLTAALRRWKPAQEYGAGRLLLALWLVLITHPLLDAFTIRDRLGGIEGLTVAICGDIVHS
ncbi:MAG: metal-dependent hydrolase, partial [Pollutimonas bauzanensis]